MREFVARANIAQYQDRLKRECDLVKREKMAKLLSEQEAELKRAIELKEMEAPGKRCG